MPSQYQSGSGSYDNEAERFMSVDLDVEPLIRGIESEDRILMWWNTVNRMGIEGEVKEQVQDRMAYLKERKA